MKKLFLFLVVVISFMSCGPKVNVSVKSKDYKPLDENIEIVVIETHEESPKNAVLIGGIEIGDTGFSINCGPSKVMEIAKSKARAIGANIIKLHEAESPNFVSSCYRIRASFYRSNELR